MGPESFWCYPRLGTLKVRPETRDPTQRLDQGPDTWDTKGGIREPRNGTLILHGT